MVNEMNIILLRRREVEQEIARAREVIANGEKELAELDAAGAVIARLTGASWSPAGEGDERKKTGDAVRPSSRGLTVPEMIKTVLEKAHRRGLKMMEPKDIRQEIARTLDPNIRSEAVSSITWRMWKRGQIEKVEGTSAYRLPDKEKPAGEQSVEDAPTGLFSNPEHGREAGQGGGT